MRVRETTKGMKALGGLGIAAALAITLLLAASASAKRPNPAAGAGEHLTPFAGCGAFVHYAARRSPRLVRYEDTFGAGTGAGGNSKAKQSPAATGEGDDAPPEPPSGTSATNAQEEGVDEPDIVKTDGKRIFTIEGGALRSVDITSAQPVLLDSLRLRGDEQQLLLVGSRLLVLSYDFGRPPGAFRSAHEANPTTILTEVDASDPASLKIVAKQTVDGSLVDARLTGTTIRAVVASEPAAAYIPRRHLRSRLARWAPYSSLRRGGKRRTRPLIRSCGDIQHTQTFSGLGMVTVLTIDMTRGLPAIDTDAVMSDADLVYASKKSLYVTSYATYGGNSIADTKTAIHKFDTSSATETRYVATGMVGGTLLDQFSMSEDAKGRLRVASTSEWYNRRGRRQTESAVSFLEQQGDRLAGLGRVGGLGRGEDVQAVRMIGDVGYVVTFRQIDPLYTLDLSDPNNPRVAGELKILGYSSYLHPISDDLLLGVGIDADDRGRQLGALVSLFDVSDPAQPKLVDREPLPGVQTAVESTHHAFLYWQPANLALIPVESYGKRRTLSGALGFKVQPDGLSAAGILSRAGLGEHLNIDRTLVANGRVFAVSCGGVETASLEGLQTQAWLPFKPARRGACFGNYAF